MSFRRLVPFKLNPFSIVLLTFCCVRGTISEDCSIRKTSSKLFCYYSKATDVNSCLCTHVVLPFDADVKAIDAVRKRLTDVKVLLTVNSFSESLIALLNATRVDGLDLRLTKLTSKHDIQDFISTVRGKLDGQLLLTLSVPARPELLAKYYDFKGLSKQVDSFVLETAFLGASGNVTFHPSRLSGVWDVQNTDSVVDLITGLGAPLQKLVISAPVQAFKFTLQDAGHTAPGSPALELSTISRRELCDVMGKDKWMLERDQDQAGPYIFRDTTWIAFEDPTSIDIKSKYSRVRGLGGLALKDLSQDYPCTHDRYSLTILEAAHAGLNKQSRAPRGAVLQSLEREILGGDGGRERLLDTVQMSPYRITRVVDTEGKVHAIRQDTRTEFECARQGYFVHPRSCGRFYRCVKFDQLTDEYSVFEFDCPAGLVFDVRVEVCVWPGSLKQASACAGSSEITPVPRERFLCPGEPGYYADPENCRWFFACIDHGKSPISAYEFRCPFGLVFDQERLLCEWPWLVSKCSSGFADGAYEEYSYGGIGTGSLAGSGYLTTEDSGFSRTALVLGQYNGLGSLNSVALGGLSGPLVQQVARTYSSFNAGQLSYGKDVGVNGNVLDYKPIGTSVFGHGHQARLNDFVEDSHLLNAQVDLYKISDQQQDRDSELDVDVRFGNTDYQKLIDYKQPQEFGGLYFQQSNLDSLKLVTSNPTSLPGAAISYINQNQEYLPDVDKMINIIGGGFSAVSSGIELSQHGHSINHIEHLTPLPAEGSSTIATVTSVPVPFVQRTVTDFDTYQGGVVANVPSLQHKIKSGAVNALYNQQQGSNQSLIGFKDLVSSAIPVVPVAFVSSTPVSFGPSIIAPSVAQVQKLESYDYPKPIQYVVERPAVIATKQSLPPVIVTTFRPSVVVTKEYLPPASVSTMQTPIIQTQQYVPPSTLIKPVTGHSFSSSYQSQVHAKVEKPVVQIQQSIGYEIPPVQLPKQDYKVYNYGHRLPTIVRTDGYSYPKPTIKFEDIPKINQVFSYTQPVVQGYSYSKPSIGFEEKPPAVSSQSFIKHNTFGQPLEITQFVQPPVSIVPKVVVQENRGYTYPKPVVQFVQNTAPVDKDKQVHVGYDYPKPDIKFEETPVVNTQYVQTVVSKPQEQTYVYQQQQQQLTQYVNPLLKPKVVSQGYSYLQPVTTFTEKPVASSHSYVQHHSYIKPLEVLKPIVPVETRGYIFPKPAIRFEERPVQFVSSKPAIVVQVQDVQQNIGYLYPKPSIKFEEKPAIIQQAFVASRPVVHQEPVVIHHQTSYVKPLQPVVHVQENIPYEYQKPIVKFEEPPINYGTLKPTVHLQQNIGYEYRKPAIKFEEKPAIIEQPFVVTRPVVEPVVHIQENVGYSYTKPLLKFEEKPAIVQQAFVASRPVVHQEPVVVHHQTSYVKPLQPVVHVQENIPYEYQKPIVKFEEPPINYGTPKPTIHFQQNVGYEYLKPAIKFEEKPAIIEQPFVVTRPVVQPVVHVQENVGYSYPKPLLKFEEKPAVVQQAFVASRPVLQQEPGVIHHQTSYVKPVQPVVHVQENIPYEYQKPIVKFEEPPINYGTPKPTVHLQQNIGYEYPKPVIKFEEKPAIIEQPFVATRPVVEPVVHIQENVGYSYTKPLLKFEEKPAIVQQSFVTTRPVLHQEPAVIHHQTSYIKPLQPVVHVQENIPYEYQKPIVKFEEPPINYGTPKPTVHLQQNIGYEYRKPAIKFEEKPAIIEQPFVVTRPVVEPVVHIQENVGYSYTKPLLKFEEKPAIVQQSFVTTRPVLHQEPAVIHHQTSYIKPLQPVVHVQENIPYEYQKPIVKFEEPPINYGTPKPTVHLQQNIGYEYPKPVIKFEEKPAIIEQPFVATRPVVEPVVHIQENVGYSYTKPLLKFEEKPTVVQQAFVASRPVVHQEPVVIHHQTSYVKPLQPVVHVQENIPYEYPKPTLKFEERPTSYGTPKPTIHFQQNIGYEYTKPAIKFEEKPAVIQQTIVTPRPVVQPVVHVEENIGYSYLRPTVKFEEKPFVQQTYVKPLQPVSTYGYSSIAVKQYIPPVTTAIHQPNFGYKYPKPAVRLEEKPVYQNLEHKQILQQPPVVYEAKPIRPAILPPTYSYQQPRPFQVGIQQPVRIQTYQYQQKPVVQPNIQVGYEYPKPQLKFEERPVIISYETKQPVEEEIIVPKKAYVTGYHQQRKSEEYVYNKPAVDFEEVQYEAPRVTPRPSYVSTIASVVVPKIQQHQQTFYSYDSRFEPRPQQVLVPQIVEQQQTVVESKPIFKYEFSSLDNSINSYVAPVQKDYLPQLISTTSKYIDPVAPVLYSPPVLVQQYGTTRKPQIILEEQKTYLQSKPIAQYEFSSFDTEYKTYIAPPKVQKEYLPVQSTPKYVVQNIELPQSKAIVQYEFNSFDSSRFEPQKEFIKLQSATKPKFQIDVPDLEYLPVRKPPKVYLPASTTERIQPPRVYLPTSRTEEVVVRTRKPTTTERVIAIHKKTYLPVTTSTTENVPVIKPVRGYLPVVKLDREYLPIKKTGKIIENYEAEQSEEVVSKRPVKVLKIVRPKSKSIVKVNDFHPILSAKLGAQCTCTSNTVKLRKPAKKIVVEIEDTRISDLDEYISDDNENGDIIIEDYQYESQKVQNQEVPVTKSPEVILKSTTQELYSNAPAPNLIIKKRLRVRPTSTTTSYEDLPLNTKPSDIFIRRSNRPRTKQIVIIDDPNNEEIAYAVKTSLKLVKSAVKEGVKEGIRESSVESSKSFDRYGPGGVRSRSETLQGTIDCQRAGLFRHPTHCNNFYACRWDCKKNRFTLHVFNCPVHLTFDNNLGACNWPSQGPACVDNTLLPNE